MIDWLEPDLRQTEQETVNCAAGNYFVLKQEEEEKKKMEEEKRGEEREAYGGCRGIERNRKGGSLQNGGGRAVTS